MTPNSLHTNNYFGTGPESEAFMLEWCEREGVSLDDDVTHLFDEDERGMDDTSEAMLDDIAAGKLVLRYVAP